MKLTNGVIEKACSDDEARPTLCQPWLQEGYLYATDAYIAVKVPAEVGLMDVDGPVPVASLKGARKGGKQASLEVDLANGTAVTITPDGKLETERPAELPPPDVTALIPVIDGGRVLAINAAYLHRLADALGEEQVRLTLPADDTTPIIVEPATRLDDRIGLLMQVRIRTEEPVAATPEGVDPATGEVSAKAQLDSHIAGCGDCLLDTQGVALTKPCAAYLKLAKSLGIEEDWGK